MATFKDATVEGLNTLVGLWNHGNAFRKCGTHGGCFWMAGNLFHTAVESMRRTKLQKDTYGIGKEALAYFDESISVPPIQGDGAINTASGWMTTDGGESLFATHILPRTNFVMTHL